MSDLFVGMSGPALASGAGPVESITGAVDSAINGDPVAASGQGLAFGLQALGFVDNPLGTLATSTIGWLLEHLGPLNFALDATTGDPAAVDDAARRFTEAAGTLDRLASEHAGSLSRDLPTYFSAATGTGQLSSSARAFHGAMSTRFDDLKTASAACSGIASLITFSGELVAITRGIIRDLLAEFAWKRLERAAMMTAAAPFTFGSAAAWFLADSMLAQGTTLGAIYNKLALLNGSLQRVAGTIRQLNAILTKVLGSPLRQSVLSNSIAESAKAAGKIIQQDRPGSAASAEMPGLPPTPDEKAKQQQPAFPRNPPAKPVYGPPPNARWTTSGTLDE